MDIDRKRKYYFYAEDTDSSKAQELALVLMKKQDNRLNVVNMINCIMGEKINLYTTLLVEKIYALLVIQNWIKGM